MYVPSLLVFPRSNMKAEHLDSPPSGSIAARWIQRESCTQRFKHFVCFMKLSKIDPVFLTLDGHYSHSRNIEVIDCARKNGMHIVCLPPQSTATSGSSLLVSSEDISRTGVRNLAERPSKQSCYTLSNY